MVSGLLGWERQSQVLQYIRHPSVCANHCKCANSYHPRATLSKWASNASVAIATQHCLSHPRVFAATIAWLSRQRHYEPKNYEKTRCVLALKQARSLNTERFTFLQVSRHLLRSKNDDEVCENVSKWRWFFPTCERRSESTGHPEHGCLPWSGHSSHKDAKCSQESLYAEQRT